MKKRATLLALTLAAGCTGDPDTRPNVLPDFRPLPDQGRPDATGGGPGGGAVVPPGPEFPQAYRFECIHIDKLGENQANGAPPIQAGVLNRLWVADINKHRLNILIGIDSVDTVTNQAQVFIGSGIGLDDASQCREPTTDGTRFPAALQPGTAVYATAPAADTTTCARPAAEGEAAYATVDVNVPSEGAIYIYAQDEKGVYFNCTPDEALPQAVPLRQVRARVTLTPSGDRIAGELTACLLESDIAQLCSCIGQCAATSLEDTIPADMECGGCPKGGIPLAKQLMGIISSPECEALTGGTAYELKATFNAVNLPGDPALCQ